MKKILLSVALALAVGSPISASALDIEPFIRKDRFGTIKLSPKGEYYAATVPLEDQTILVMIRRSDSKVLSKFGLGRNTVITGFTWVNPERVVFSVGEKFGGLDQPSPTGELFAMDADGTQPELLVGYRVQTNTGTGVGSKIQAKKVEAVGAALVDHLKDDDRNVIITVWNGSDFPRAEKMDVYTGRRVRVATAPVRAASFYTDNAGVVRFASGEEFDGTTKLYHRAGEGDPWKLVNDEASSGREEFPVGFAQDNGTVYLQVESSRGPDRIVAMNMASGERRDLLADEVADPAAMLYAPGSDEPAGAVFDRGGWVSRFFDETSAAAKLQRRLEKAFPGSAVFITSETADGSLALVRVSSDRNPGDYYLFDTRKLNAEFLLSNREWFDPERMHPAEPVVVKARDGLELRGILTRPSGSKGRRLPMVVLPHGGPFGVQDNWGFDTEAQMLASAGYVVLQVNFRGSGGYGRAFQEAGRKQWGKTMQDDLTDATKWAIESGVADPGKICLYGASYGGYASLMGLVREPGLYRCAAGYVGVYDLPTLHTDGDTRRRAWGRNFINEWIGARDAVAEVSPTKLAASIKAPVFLAAGGEDERAPIEHSRMMERALQQAGVPVETLYYPTEGHGFYKPEHRREFYTRLLAFLGRHLGGATASAASPASAK